MKPCVDSIEFLNAVSVEQMRKSDKYTIDNFTESKVLMYRAAEGVYSSFDWKNKNIAIVCGSGNNGGDGYALAGILAENGYACHIYRVSERFSDDGLYYYNEALKKGVGTSVFDGSTELSGYDVIVDCILGTGFKGEPKDKVKKAIEMINDSTAYVISVDINSGLNGDDGSAVLAVKSDLTVSIGFYKKGLFLGRAPLMIGELVNVDIGIVLCE